MNLTFVWAHAWPVAKLHVASRYAQQSFRNNMAPSLLVCADRVDSNRASVQGPLRARGKECAAEDLARSGSARQLIRFGHLLDRGPKPRVADVADPDLARFGGRDQPLHRQEHPLPLGGAI